jgi:PAS domain S-box-containing protein
MKNTPAVSSTGDDVSKQALRRQAEASRAQIEALGLVLQTLRRQAEARLVRTLDIPESLSPDEIRDTLHELRVHQIELEMQNEELRRAQAEIEAGRARYFDLYDLAPVGYCTVSEQGLILEANLTAATLLGTARSALVNRPLSQFIIKEDQDLYYLQRKQLFETGETRECELRLVKPDGSNFWAHLTATAAQAEDGAPLCRVVLSDITGRKQMEEDLRRSERLFRLDFEESPVGRCLIGLDGRFLMTNQAFCVLQGRSASELGGMSFLEVTHPEDHDASREGMRQLLDGTLDRFDLEKRYLVSEQRTVWASVRVGLIRDEAGEPLHFSLFVQDISERKLAEEAMIWWSRAFRMPSGIGMSRTSACSSRPGGRKSAVTPSTRSVTAKTSGIAAFILRICRGCSLRSKPTSRAGLRCSRRNTVSAAKTVPGNGSWTGVSPSAAPKAG